MKDKLCLVVVIMGVIGMVRSCVPQSFGRPFGQPALVSDHAAYGVDGPTGFDQARRREPCC
jgi:hypothetical protein